MDQPVAANPEDALHEGLSNYDDLAATVLPPRRRTVNSRRSSSGTNGSNNGSRASHLTLIDARTDERERTAPGITSISAIARKSHLSTQHIGRVLRGQEGASFEAACRIADAAGVTLDALRAHIERQAARLVAG